jgi:hypothetical protein
MSSLLEQAIVDASALKEAALKNAESAVLEKYSGEVKNALDTLLEQDMGMPMPMPAAAPMGVAPDASFIDDVPLAHEDSSLGGPDDEEVIEIDFDDLRARLHAEEEEGIEPLPSEMMGSEETAEEIFGAEEVPAGAEPLPEVEPLAEDIEISDELLDAIAEELTVDVSAQLGGWAPVASGLTTPHVKEMEAEEAAVAAQSEEATEEEEKYVELYESQLTNLQREVGGLRSLLVEAKDQLNILILENAKLLYQNKALNSASLNERQKEKIVEAVRNASSVEETKMLFETLQSAVGGHRTRRIESLREAVSRPTTSMLLSSNSYRGSNASTTVDPNMDRMLRLAGLKQ